MDDTPSQGSVWKHKKGNKYNVIMLTNMDGDRVDPDFPPTVVYKGEDGRVWSRPLSRWCGSFTPIPFDVENISFDSLRVDTYSVKQSGWIVGIDYAVRITHLPTGVYAECNEYRSQHKNKAIAFEKLKQKLKEMYM